MQGRRTAFTRGCKIRRDGLSLLDATTKCCIPGYFVPAFACSARLTPLLGAETATFQMLQTRWKARKISLQEYSKAIGRPCGQLVG